MTKSKAVKLYIACFLVACAVVGVFIVDWGALRTNNAYVSADPVQVTAQVSGIVSDVYVVDTQMVGKGALLLSLDDHDLGQAEKQAQYALQSSELEYRQALLSRRSSGLTAANSSNEKKIAEIQFQTANDSYNKAKRDFARLEALHRDRWISEESYLNALDALRAREHALQEQRQRAVQAANNVEISNNSSQSEADSVDRLAAEINTNRAKLDIAQTSLKRAKVYAQTSGIVATRKVNRGQHVEIGTVLMQIIPLDQLYVNANFKENQIGKIEIGDRVSLKSDIYGDDVVFHGRVAGLSGGTGAAFSAIPAVNASGNWVKVPQRLPVRISLDAAELKRHPLRLGLSMTATVHRSR
jgi:membrane fusion protein (multidrug efflux system)